jgi:hypothetical protein
VVLAFLAPSPRAANRSEQRTRPADDEVESELAGLPTRSGTPALSVGILSATQGAYVRAQFLLDITQGARVSASAYDPSAPPALSIRSQSAPSRDGMSTAQASPWSQVLRRARAAPQILEPGLLAASIPGEAGYAGVSGQDHKDAVTAANREGHVAAFSSGPPQSLVGRISALLNQQRLVVADLPNGPLGYEELRTLNERRREDELLIVAQRASTEPGNELLWSAVSGLGEGRALSSQTTDQYGLIAAIDLAPTILHHLGLVTPSAMRGEAIHTDGALNPSYLRSLKARVQAVYSRRLPALGCLLCAWALLLLACARDWAGRDWSRHRARAMRVGALALLWTPFAVLLPAILEPSRTVEYGVLVTACFLLGAVTDRLLPWPRAPLAPAIVAIVALTADALAGTQLLMRSLLGPNPSFGARFYGIGNELKSGLAVLVLAAVAAALYPAVRGRRAALTVALAGIALAIVEGSARIGAGVGGVILVSAGTAVATVLLLPGQITRRRALIVLISPVVGLVALAAIDLATAHGAGHFTGSVLHARSAGDLRDILVRRYRAAWNALKDRAMPAATFFALLATVIGVRQRERLCSPVGSDPAWFAALAGGLAAGVVGALSEDSGPVLLVVAVFALVCVLAYLWGRPSGTSSFSSSSPPS